MRDRLRGVTHDLVIRNAHLVDGSGAPGRVADVAVDGSLITAVEPGGTLGDGVRTIDADGLLLTPGFVDTHTHYDAQVTWDPYVTPSGWHGVTTVMMGNCGVGFAPSAPEQHEWLIEMMESVEDIPGTALSAGLQWGWESYSEYLDVLASMPRVMDIGSQIGHCPLRVYVMGDRGVANEPATDADITTMSQMVEEALRAGAFGFTTSPWYAPMNSAQAHEVRTLMRVAGDYGGLYATHMRSYTDRLVESLAEELSGIVGQRVYVQLRSRLGAIGDVSAAPPPGR